MMTTISQSNTTCPNCGGTDVHSHTLSTWCMRCGWGQNHRAEASNPVRTLLAGLLAAHLGEIQKTLRHH